MWRNQTRCFSESGVSQRVRDSTAIRQAILSLISILESSSQSNSRSMFAGSFSAVTRRSRTEWMTASLAVCGVSRGRRRLLRIAATQWARINRDRNVEIGLLPDAFPLAKENISKMLLTRPVVARPAGCSFMNLLFRRSVRPSIYDDRTWPIRLVPSARSEHISRVWKKSGHFRLPVVFRGSFRSGRGNALPRQCSNMVYL